MTHRAAGADRSQAALASLELVARSSGPELPLDVDKRVVRHVEDDLDNLAAGELEFSGEYRRQSSNPRFTKATVCAWSMRQSVQAFKKANVASARARGRATGSTYCIGAGRLATGPIYLLIYRSETTRRKRRSVNWLEQSLSAWTDFGSPFRTQEVADAWFGVCPRDDRVLSGEPGLRSQRL
jgi:hypothetical protein